MNKVKVILALMLTGTLLFGACENEAPNMDDTSVAIVFDNQFVELPSQGGDYSLSYSIKNPISGATILATTTSDWITITNITDTAIDIHANSNNTFDSRYANIEVKYPTLEHPTYVTISQLAPTGTAFSFEIKDLTTTSCTGIVNSADPNMYYIAILSDVEYFTGNNILTEEDLFRDDYDYFMNIAAQNDMMLKDYIVDYVAKQGRSEFPWTGMTPASKYVLYAYGIELSTTGYKQTTPIQYMVIDTPLPELLDATFDIDITVNGTDVTFDMTPHNWHGYYCIDFYASTSASYLPKGTPVDDEYTRRIARNWINTLIAGVNQGYEIDDVVVAYCFTGPSLYEYSLRPNVDYIAVVYAIDYCDDIPQLVSKPCVEYFTTCN